MSPHWGSLNVDQFVVILEALTGRLNSTAFRPFVPSDGSSLSASRRTFLRVRTEELSCSILRLLSQPFGIAP